jgi:antirestriction protein ArdC
MTTPGHHGVERGYPSRDHYTEVTDRIIAGLDAGTPPWRQPWESRKCGNPGKPCNAVTVARYRGINVVTLAMSPLALATGDPRWTTYKQAAACGWQVRKGSKGTTAFFYKKIDLAETAPDDDRTAKPGHIAVLRAPSRSFTPARSKIFRPSRRRPLTRRRGAPPTRLTLLSPTPASRLSPAATARSTRPPPIRSTCRREMHLTRRPAGAARSFTNWRTATMAEDRPDRDLRRCAFGSPDYAKEELRAEIAQVTICAELGIAECEFSNSAAYIKNWTDILRSDRKEIFRAAAEAQRIADYLLACHPDYAARHPGTASTSENLPPARDETATGQPLAA